MDLRERIYYDSREEVLMADLSNLQADIAFVKEIFDLEIEIAKSLSEKPYMLVNYKDFHATPEAHEYYAQRIDELIAVVKGIVRYEVSDFMTKIMLKVENMSRGKPINIYSSKEAALRAIRKGQV